VTAWAGLIVYYLCTGIHLPLCNQKRTIQRNW